jgi:hypothetical protein
VTSSSVFCRRWTCRLRSRVNCLRVHSNSRISWVCGSGAKLPRIRPCASRSGCVGQHEGEVAVAQDMPHWLPVNADRLHRDVGACLSQPRVRELLSSEHFSVDGTLIEDIEFGWREPSHRHCHEARVFPGLLDVVRRVAGGCAVDAACRHLQQERCQSLMRSPGVVAVRRAHGN